MGDDTGSVVRTDVSGAADAVRTLTREYFTEANSLGRDYFDEDDYGVDIRTYAEKDVERLAEGTPPEPLFLARTDGDIAGMGQLHRHDEQIVTAKRVFIRQEYRGNGLGRALVEEMLDAAREEGFETFRLNVSPYHERAQALYESLGFEETPPPEWTDVTEAYHDDWVFLCLSLS